MAVESRQERAIEAADRSSAGAGQRRRHEVHRQRIRIRKPRRIALSVSARTHSGRHRRGSHLDCCLGDVYPGARDRETATTSRRPGSIRSPISRRQLERTEAKYASSAVDAGSSGCRSCRGWSTSSSQESRQRISSIVWYRRWTGWSKALSPANPRTDRRRRRRDEKKINRTHALVLAGNKAVVNEGVIR